MLKIINPRDHETQRQRIDAFLDLLTVYQEFDLALEKQAKSHFIIAETHEDGVYGGAVIYPQKVSRAKDLLPCDTRESVLGKMFSAFQPKAQEFWMARVHICMGEDPSIWSEEAIDCSQEFYRNIYKELIKFERKKGLEFLAFSLRSPDTVCSIFPGPRFTENVLKPRVSIPSYKNWPQLLEIRLSGPSDGFFHGILAVKKNKSKSGKKKKSKAFSKRSYKIDKKHNFERYDLKRYGLKIDSPEWRV